MDQLLDAAGSSGAVALFGVAFGFLLNWLRDGRQNRREDRRRFADEKLRLSAELVILCGSVRRTVDKSDASDADREAVLAQIEQISARHGPTAVFDEASPEIAELKDRASAYFALHESLAEEAERHIAEVTRIVGFLVMLAPYPVQNAASDMTDALTAEPFDEDAYDAAQAHFVQLARTDLGT